VCVNAIHLPRLREQGAADAWTSISDANVTFSYSICCNETNYVDNVLTSIDALRFCFTDVLLIIDVPHGEPGGYSEFLLSTWGEQMIILANKTAQAAVALLQSRCPLSLPGAHLQVLNYDEPAMRTALGSDFGVNAVGFAFNDLYKNTMVYDKLWHLPDTQYVWHADADVRILRIAEGASPNFVETSIRLLRSDSRVVLTAPPKNLWGYQLVNLREFDVRWHQGEALSKTYILTPPILTVSVDAFFMDVQRLRSLLPFNSSHATEQVERIMTPTFQANDAHQVFLDCSMNVISEHLSHQRQRWETCTPFSSRLGL